ncbi:MAG: alkyl hydroperoxide reductase, partial [Actinomycetota bacterium]|nr:alkyl hydroperoxide reductase [Actinomycetota bacterium]
RYDPQTESVSTLATGLAEPSGAVLVDGELVVVESAAHRLVRAVPNAALIAGDSLRTQRPVTAVAPGPVVLDVMFTAPAGRKLDERDGPSTRLTVSASPPELLLDGAGDSTTLTRRLVLAADIPEGVLHVSAQAASCDDDPAVEHPACYLSRQDWGVPVRTTAQGSSQLRLVLLD